jgi:hypothetical protein
MLMLQRHPRVKKAATTTTADLHHFHFPLDVMACHLVEQTPQSIPSAKA